MINGFWFPGMVGIAVDATGLAAVIGADIHALATAAALALVFILGNIQP